MLSTRARQEILDRIGEALSHRAAGEPSSPDNHSTLANDDRYDASDAHSNRVQQRDALILQFEEELAAVGGLFHRAPNAAAACDCVVRIASVHKARKAIAWDLALIGDIGLATSLGEAGIEFTPGSAGVPPAIIDAASADIGVTAVDYALADTGTLVLRSGPGRARSVSLLPPVHIALLRPDQIIPGLDDLFPLLARDNESEARPDSALTFITGPSRTADIELTLVVGVHGPQELHVILLDEDNRAKEGD
ncbi:MAG: lactate utilization protein [Acidobacteriota bacterium]